MNVLLVMTARTVGGAELYVERLTAAWQARAGSPSRSPTILKWPTWDGGWPGAPRC